MESFARKLRLLRTQAQMTQDDVATSLGISRSTVGMYEQNRRDPEFEILVGVSELFHVSLSSLVSDGDVNLDEEELLYMYRSVDDVHREIAKEVLKHGMQKM